jgi:hypothetical protein
MIFRWLKRRRELSARVSAEARRVGKGALCAVHTIFESNVFAPIGGHAAGRVRARPLLPTLRALLFPGSEGVENLKFVGRISLTAS